MLCVGPDNRRCSRISLLILLCSSGLQLIRCKCVNFIALQIELCGTLAREGASLGTQCGVFIAEVHEQPEGLPTVVLSSAVTITDQALESLWFWTNYVGFSFNKCHAAISDWCLSYHQTCIFCDILKGKLNRMALYLFMSLVCRSLEGHRPKAITEIRGS